MLCAASNYVSQSSGVQHFLHFLEPFCFQDLKWPDKSMGRACKNSRREATDDAGVTVSPRFFVSRPSAYTMLLS